MRARPRIAALQKSTYSHMIQAGQQQESLQPPPAKYMNTNCISERPNWLLPSCCCPDAHQKQQPSRPHPTTSITFTVAVSTCHGLSYGRKERRLQLPGSRDAPAWAPYGHTKQLPPPPPRDDPPNYISSQAQLPLGRRRLPTRSALHSTRDKQLPSPGDGAAAFTRG